MKVRFLWLGVQLKMLLVLAKEVVVKQEEDGKERGQERSK